MNLRTKLMIGSAAILALPLMALAAQDAPNMPPEPPMPPAPMMQTMFDEADTNKDGFIDKAEHQAMANKRFDEADSNKDGKLSPDEMKQAHRERREDRREMRFEMMGGDMPPMGPDGMGPDMADANKDGKINFDEFVACHEDHFKMLDANHDGFIDKDEMSKPAVKVMVLKRDDATKGEKMEQRIEQRIEMRLDGSDTNKDKKISLAEFNAGQKTFFDKLDANHDGALDPSEMPKPMMHNGRGGDHKGHGRGGPDMMGPGMMGDGLQVNCKVVEEKTETK